MTRRITGNGAATELVQDVPDADDGAAAQQQIPGDPHVLAPVRLRSRGFPGADKLDESCIRAHELA